MEWDAWEETGSNKNKRGFEFNNKGNNESPFFCQASTKDAGKKGKRIAKMPKFYVRDGYEYGVMDAETPEDAICMCVIHRFSTFVINGFYIVSEVGFEKHDDDIIFSSDFIIDIISDRFGDEFRKNPRKDEEGY